MVNRVKKKIIHKTLQLIYLTITLISIPPFKSIQKIHISFRLKKFLHLNIYLFFSICNDYFINKNCMNEHRKLWI